MLGIISSILGALGSLIGCFVIIPAGIVTVGFIGFAFSMLFQIIGIIFDLAFFWL